MPVSVGVLVGAYVGRGAVGGPVLQTGGREGLCHSKGRGGACAMDRRIRILKGEVVGGLVYRQANVGIGCGERSGDTDSGLIRPRDRGGVGEPGLLLGVA